MSFSSLLFDILFSDLKTTLISLFIGFVVYKLSKFYYTVLTLPPGPLPLPLVGNILLLRAKDKHWDTIIKETCKRYGPVSTFWFGTTPTVIVSDIDLGREA